MDSWNLLRLGKQNKRKMLDINPNENLRWYLKSGADCLELDENSVDVSGFFDVDSSSRKAMIERW